MGTSIPTRVQRVVFMRRTPKSASMMNHRMPRFNHCRVGESERVVTFGAVPPLLALCVISLPRSQFGRFRLEANNDQIYERELQRADSQR